jgi:hypothetical protein
MPERQTIGDEASDKVLFVRIPRSVYLAIRKAALDRDTTVRQMVMDWGRELDRPTGGQAREAA